MAKPKSQSKNIVRRTLIEVLTENGVPMTPEELFQATGHSQESVDHFFAELREATSSPAIIVEVRDANGLVWLRMAP